jgi:hypothetical protein
MSAPQWAWRMPREPEGFHEPWVGLDILTEPNRPLTNTHLLHGTRRPTNTERVQESIFSGIVVSIVDQIFEKSAEVGRRGRKIAVYLTASVKTGRVCIDIAEATDMILPLPMDEVMGKDYLWLQKTII